MKIVSTGSTLSSPENYRKKIKKRKRRLGLWILAIIALTVALTSVSRMEQLLIAEVRVEGARVVTEEEIASLVRQNLSGRYALLAPKANAALYPRGSIKSSLMREFPRLSSVSLSLDNPKTLTVSVVERDPFALYCPSRKDQCFFLDENGFIFDEAPDFSGLVYFVYTKEASDEDPKGGKFLPLEEFVLLSQFIKDLSRLGLEPVSLKMAGRGYELTMKNGSNMVWNDQIDFPTLYSNLSAFLRSDAIRAQPDFLEKVSLLDLRTENKVFYRFNE